MTTALERAANEVREECLGTKLRTASRVVTQRYDDAIAESGIRSTQFSVLIALAHAPFLPLSKIAEVLVLDRTTLTRNLSPLVREGLVEERSTDDKRVRAYALTAQGKKVLERALPGWRKVQAELKRALSAQDRSDLCRILNLALKHAEHA
jgi:DNA-binding MarR family transcriptional regulator